MDDQVVKVLLAGPLYVLGAIQLFGAHRLWNLKSFKILAAGIGFAVITFPLLFLVGIADAPAGLEPHLEMGGRLVRIWLIVFTLASVARIGLLIVKYVWKRRPRAQSYQPEADAADRHGPPH
jgi:hypothetical protein